MRNLCFAALAAIAFAGSANAAVTVTSNQPGVNPYTGSFTFDFDSAAKTPVYSGGAVITTGTTTNLYARPYGSVGNYFSVGPSTSDPATIFLSRVGASAISLLWGSIDTYNTLSFVDAAGNALASFTGSQMALNPNGDQADPAMNRIVTFGFTGTDAAKVAGLRLTSNGSNAFEIDSITVTSVPEPATWAMMMLGFGAIGGLLRRRGAGMIARTA